jgi:hypothetical protein
MKEFFIGGLIALLILFFFWPKVAPNYVMPKWMLLLIYTIGGIVGVIYQHIRLGLNRAVSPRKSDRRKDIWASLPINELIDRLKSSDPDTRAEAITGLATKKDLSVVPTLIEMLDDVDKNVRLRATEGLSWLRGEDFGENKVEWEVWWRKNKSESQR